MKPRTWVGAVVAVVLSFTAAGAQENCEQLERKAERAARRYEQQCSKPSPSPAPTRSPAPTPSPLPTPPCSDHDRFRKISDTHWQFARVDLEHGVERTLCVDLPPRTYPFFELYTINLENSSCSNLEMTAIPPVGMYQTDVGPAPVLRPNVQAGRWLVKLYLPWGCTKYQFNIQYPPR